MNCKQGDLAVIVHSAANNHGALVTTLHFVGDYTFKDETSVSDAWLVRAEQEIHGNDGSTRGSGDTLHISDSCLKPIRDPGEDARDETLSWLDVPTTERSRETA